MSTPATTERRSLLDSLTVLLSSLLAVAHTRLELLAVDLDEGREHLLSLLLLASAALLALGIGTVLGILAVLQLYWDSHRLLALSGLAGLFLLIGCAGWLWLLHRARTRPSLFHSSLGELGKDRQHLQPSP